MHGIQHSRNTSFVHSPSTSPLSPQIIAAVGMTSFSSDATTMVDEIRELPSITSSLVSPAAQGKQGNTSPGVALDKTATDGQAAPGSRRPEKTQSSKTRRDGTHNRSLSRREHIAEIRTVGEYALHHLFNAFIAQADNKINLCITDPSQFEPRVETICGPGVDPNFDQLITALGHIARQKPKPLIDTLMFWRQAKREAADEARTSLSRSRAPTPALTNEPSVSLDPASNGYQALIQAERRSVVSIYLLCRVLIEIISQTTLENVTQDTAQRLEDIIYSRLRAAEPEALEQSPFQQANWMIFGQVLGVMSGINFESVVGKFVEDLDSIQRQLSIKTQASREVEGRVVLLVRGMRYIRLQPTPEGWDRSCNFMLALAKLFVGAHGQPVKYAYCQLFQELMLPLAANSNADLNNPKWRAVVDTLRMKLAQLLAKPKHWTLAFPLSSVMICASPIDIFTAQWWQMLIPLQARLKERATRPLALRSISRFVWTYLYRCPDVQGVAVKKLDEIIRLVFVPGKRSYLSTEPAVAEPLIQLIRIIGSKHQELCFRSIVFSLLNSEQFGHAQGAKVENLEPERMVIGIRAFMAIMTDLENGEQPPFPASFENDQTSEAFEITAIVMSPALTVPHPQRQVNMRAERLSRRVVLTGFGDFAKEAYVKFCKILGEITIICDNAFGGQAVLDEKFSTHTPKTPMAEAFSFGRRDDHQLLGDARQGFYDLLHVAVQALPRFLSPHIPLNSLVNLLCTGTAHVQTNIAASSAQSLKSIARQSHAQQVTVGFARFIFNFDDRYATMSDGGMLGPGHIESTLQLYVELLEIWIEEIKQKIKATAESTEITSNGNRSAQVDLQTILAYADEVESHGLFFLCSPSRRVRSYAVTVLRLVTEFDKAFGKDGSRVIRIMEGSTEKVMDVNDQKLNVAERSRLQRGMRKSNVQSTLIELCSSDVAYETTLWFKVFPNLLRISSEICPFAVALTREKVCVRLSQMQKTIAAFAEGTRVVPYSGFEVAPGRTIGRLASTPPEVIIEQWKLYLVFACTTLTNSGSQLSISSPSAQHSRNPSKSSQMSHGRVNTAGDLFAGTIPFLSVAHSGIRDATVSGLGSINSNLYRTLLESLHPAVVSCQEEAKSRLAEHRRTVSSPRRNRRADHYRTEITHVYKLTSHFLQSAEAYRDEWILNNIVNYAIDLGRFLNDAGVQNVWEYQRLRIHYCGLIEELFEGINKTKDPLRWMSFETRKAAFALMEGWCGFSPNQSQISQREDAMERSAIERETDFGNQKIMSSAIESEKKELKTATLSAMATLCVSV